MITKVTITPKFSAKEIVDTTIKKDWFAFQSQSFDLGNRMLTYMQTYINTHRKRSGGTGNLANAMQLSKTTGMAQIWWGIGHIPTLNKQAKYWYVLNFGKTVSGKKFIPGGGKYRPVKFTDGRADSNKRAPSYGNAKAITIIKRRASDPLVSPIRPINYIESTRHRLNKELELLITKLKLGF